MRRQQGTLVLVVLLIVLLLGWWSIPKEVSTPLSPAGVSSVHSAPPDPALVIHHSVTKNIHTYAGELPMRDCDSFSTALQALAGEPTHITLAFVVTPSASCSAAQVGTAAFSTSFSSSNVTVPLLEAVLVNNAPTTFEVVEDN